MLELALVQWVFLLAIAGRAYYEGYLTMSSARVSAEMAEPGTRKPVACLVQHGGYWAAYIVAILLAYILDGYARYWTAQQVVTVGFFWAGFVALVPLAYWAKQSLGLWESLARFGLPSIPGTMNAMLLVFGLSVLTLYYVGRPPIALAAETWTITGVLAAFVLAGVLLPSVVTYRKIRRDPLAISLGLWIVLLIATFYRTG